MAVFVAAATEVVVVFKVTAPRFKAEVADPFATVTALKDLAFIARQELAQFVVALGVNVIGIRAFNHLAIALVVVGNALDVLLLGFVFLSHHEHLFLSKHFVFPLFLGVFSPPLDDTIIAQG